MTVNKTEVVVAKTRVQDKIGRITNHVTTFKVKNKPQLDIIYEHSKDTIVRIEVKRSIDDVVGKFQSDGYSSAFQHYLGLKYTIMLKQRNTGSDNEFVESKLVKKDFSRIVTTSINETAISLVKHVSLYVVPNAYCEIRVFETVSKGSSSPLYQIVATFTGSTAEEKTQFENYMQTLQQAAKSTSSASSSTPPPPLESITSSSKKSPSNEKSNSKSASIGKSKSAPWVLPNRVGFSKWMYERYNPEKYTEKSLSSQPNKKIKLFPHQRLVKDFMEFNSPFRGMLLYHGLGVGKTCASIAAAEGFLVRNKRVYVLLPASLAQNYKNEILRCSTIGNPSLKVWNAVTVPENQDNPSVRRLMETYNLPFSFIKKHHNRMWFPEVIDGVPYIQRNVSWQQMSESEQASLVTFLQEFVEHKYTFISYNGATKKTLDALGSDAFSDSFIVMDEAHNFISRVVNGGKIARKLFTMIMESARSKMIFLTGTPIINHPYELCVLLNLIRGTIATHQYTVKKGKELPSKEQVELLLESSDILKYIDTVNINVHDRNIEIQLLPDNFVRTTNFPHVINERWTMTSKEVATNIRQILMNGFEIDNRVSLQNSYALPVQKEEFEDLFLDMKDPDNPVVKNTDLFMRRILGLVSYFKTAGEEYFPTVMPRVLEDIPMTPYQFSQYVDVRDKERRMETNMKRQNAVQGGLFGKKGTVYRAFSRMACNFVFPEYIKREFPGDLRKALQKEIAINEEEEDNDKKEEQVDKDVQKKYEAALSRALHELDTSSQEPLSEEKLQSLYSPKFARIVKHVMESPGSCLLYSQFRKVEGIGIMKMVLNHAGFKEISVEKTDSGWQISNFDAVMDKQFDGKRYVIFNEDREKTDILIKIFNGMIDELPATIVSTLQQHGYDNNLHGELARVIMISQSGAEGISLKNVRRVLITEPFWNRVRIDQVIGRAVRTGSHLQLPPEERNVQVFMYTSTFTKDQLKDNFTLVRLDDSMTSDQHIFHIAEQKSNIIQQFLDMLKRASLDCINNSTKNGMVQSGMQCYSFPINMEDGETAYAPSIGDEKRKLAQKRLEKTRKIQGKVTMKNGKKYVIIDGIPGYYDYTAYKDAGVLIAASL